MNRKFYFRNSDNESEICIGKKINRHLEKNHFIKWLVKFALI